jgi:hypothetical protein
VVEVAPSRRELPQNDDYYIKIKATTTEEIVEALKTKKEMEEEGTWPLGIIVENITMPVELVEEMVGLKVIQEHQDPPCVMLKVCTMELPLSKNVSN